MGGGSKQFVFNWKSLPFFEPIYNLATHFLTVHRGYFVVIFLLPISFFYDLYWNLSRKWNVWFHHSPEKHDEKVSVIQALVLKAKGTKMCTGRPGWLAMSLREGIYKNTMTKIPLQLYDILSINETERTVRVEPLCTMGQITAALIPKGWSLAVVPELDDLTVGGLINGFGIETSSHLHGLFQHICTAFEIVMPDGSLVRATKDENSDLFYGIPWSHGCLGFLVAAEIKIVPAKSFVKLTYYPYDSKKKAVEAFESFSSSSKPAAYDFVEGLAFSEEKYVIMTGELTDDAEASKINAIGLYWKPWFYKHVEGFLENSTDCPSSVEYIPLRHYYHRHTRSIFWEMKDIIPFGNHWLFRLILGWLIPPHISLLKLTQTEAIKKIYEEKHVIQDMLVPMKNLGEAISVFHKEYNLYPLWLCPFNLPAQPAQYAGLVCRTKKDEMFVDIGAYGLPQAAAFEARKTGLKVEEYVRRVKGYQALYADSFMSRAEFREMFDHSLIDRLRAKYNCEEALPEIYDKVNRKARK